VVQLALFSQTVLTPVTAISVLMKPANTDAWMVPAKKRLRKQFVIHPVNLTLTVLMPAIASCVLMKPASTDVLKVTVPMLMALNLMIHSATTPAFVKRIVT